MFLLSSFPGMVRRNIVVSAIGLGLITAGLWQTSVVPAAPQAAPVAVQHCSYQQADVEEFGGIGLYVGSDMSHEGRFTALEPLPGYPADLAGIKADDVIESVDGVSTKDIPAEEVVARLRGEVGSEVSVDVYRPATDERFNLTIERQLIRCQRRCR